MIVFVVLTMRDRKIEKKIKARWCYEFIEIPKITQEGELNSELINDTIFFTYEGFLSNRFQKHKTGYVVQ